MDRPETLTDLEGAPEAAPPTVDPRGQIELRLAGTAFTLRPSHQAVLAIERALGRGLVQLAAQADVGALSLGDVGIIATRLIQEAHPEASRWNADRVGQLVYSEQGGLQGAQMTLAVLLSEAVTGGFTAEGTLKAGGATTPGTTATPGVAMQDSRQPPSDGPPETGGRRRRTNGGRPGKAGAK